MARTRPSPSTARQPDDPGTANDRLKASVGSRLWSSMIAATVLHFAVFALWPTMSAADVSTTADELTHVDIPAEVHIPPEPEAIPRPMHPVIGGPDISEDLTIGSSVFDEHRPSELPPPRARSADAAEGPAFVPHTVAPRLLNEAEIARALETEYPRTLRDAGIGGTVTVHLHVDENGSVLEARVHEGSPHASLDRAALDVAALMRFSPALNLDRKVAVWVQQRITFTARQDRRPR